ncbi:glutaredoxin family protein [Mycobacteroides abscessus subsp. abscessus]|uniref:glutaredoxin family protein n=1 Tax=Mycobacteroides abscessus TaxID=36809 RepID=UPI0039EEB7AE
MTDTVTATVLSQPGCGACTFAEADLKRAGVPFVVRDVRADDAAREQLLDLYTKHREKGEYPQTPVTVVDGTAFFGAVELHEFLRGRARAATDTSAA